MAQNPLRGIARSGIIEVWRRLPCSERSRARTTWRHSISATPLQPDSRAASRARSDHGGDGGAWWPSTRPIGDRHSRCASGFHAFLFHPGLSIRLGAKPTPDLAAAAVASDFHRERLGAVGDDLELLHVVSMAWHHRACRKNFPNGANFHFPYPAHAIVARRIDAGASPAQAILGQGD
jgi:hypothetical protein